MMEPIHVLSLYIESEPGMEVKFQPTVKRPYVHDCDYVGFYISSDGEDLDFGQLCGPGHMDEEESWVDYVDGIERDDPNHRGKFWMTKLKINKISIS